MVLDADAGAPRIQTARNVSSGNFTVAIEQTQNPEPFQGYQWEIAFDPAVLSAVSDSTNDDGNAIWDAHSTGLPFCSPASQNPAAPPGTMWFGGGAGCAGATSVSFTGTLAQITFACAVADGSVSEIHLVPKAQSDFGSSFFAAGGNPMPIEVGPSITVTCGP